jgi:single-strand DNA-binding protein
MPSLNKIQLIGRLGRDPEARFTPTGKQVTYFSMAVDRRWKNEEGEVKKDTDWINVDAWGRLGEICQQYLKKGSLIYLEGRLNVDTYEHEGEKRTSYRVVALNMQMLDRKRGEDETADPPAEAEEFPF